MDNYVKTCLMDIVQCITEIFMFVENYDFDAYRQDIKTKKAVERNIEIIGEAVNRILKTDSSVMILNAKKIIATRNRIIHVYNHVSDEIIWTIIHHELPALKNEILQYLK